MYFCGEIGVCVCVCVCVSVYLVLLSHFLPFKIHLTNISPILIKMVGFKTLAWATSFATRASGKFIYLPYRASGEKSYCHTLETYGYADMHKCVFWVRLGREKKERGRVNKKELASERDFVCVFWQITQVPLHDETHSHKLSLSSVPLFKGLT